MSLACVDAGCAAYLAQMSACPYMHCVQHLDGTEFSPTPHALPHLPSSTNSNSVPLPSGAARTQLQHGQPNPLQSYPGVMPVLS